MLDRFNQSSYFTHLIERIAEDTLRLRTALLERLNLSIATSHAEIVLLLSRKGPQTMQEIAEGIYRDKSTVTVLIRKLEAQKLVKRKPDKLDARKFIVDLTSSGKKLRRPLLTTMEKVHRAFASRLSAEEQTALRRILLSLTRSSD